LRNGYLTKVYHSLPFCSKAVCGRWAGRWQQVAPAIFSWRDYCEQRHIRLNDGLKMPAPQFSFFETFEIYAFITNNMA
jgi:hypothetical protein